VQKQYQELRQARWKEVKKIRNKKSSPEPEKMRNTQVDENSNT
jgi:hypothetical protein